MEEAIIDRFEDTAFAGLSRDRYQHYVGKAFTCWPSRSPLSHPRVELTEHGKSLNIRPPGKETQKLFDALRSEINARYGLADPGDSARAEEMYAYLTMS
ncbi:hypothetical protein ACLB1M_32870 [Escherichia coli]